MTLQCCVIPFQEMDVNYQLGQLRPLVPMLHGLDCTRSYFIVGVLVFVPCEHTFPGACIRVQKMAIAEPHPNPSHDYSVPAICWWAIEHDEVLGPYRALWASCKEGTYFSEKNPKKGFCGKSLELLPCVKLCADAVQLCVGRVTSYCQQGKRNLRNPVVQCPSDPVAFLFWLVASLGFREAIGIWVFPVFHLCRTGPWILSYCQIPRT